MRPALQHYRDTGVAFPDAAAQARARSATHSFGLMGDCRTSASDGTEIAPQLDPRRNLDSHAGGA
jgi:hypothetical protein